jgi:hypothetical protein
MALFHGLQSCHTLKTLDVKVTELDKFMSQLLSLLKDHPSLVSISLSFKSVGLDAQCDFEKMSIACDNYDNNNDNIHENDSPLETLKLSIRGGISRFPTLPPSNGRLKYILELYFVTDHRMHILGEGLNRTEAIEEVHLKFHSMTSKGIKSLAKWLGNSNTKLRKLFIEGREIEVDGAKELLKAVQKNPGWLEVIDLPTSCPYRSEIQHYADMNKAGWSKMIRDDKRSSNLTLWPLVLERANNIVHSSKPSKENNQRRANTVYHLLHRPATLHRFQDNESMVDIGMGCD